MPDPQLDATAATHPTTTATTAGRITLKRVNSIVPLRLTNDEAGRRYGRFLPESTRPRGLGERCTGAAGRRRDFAAGAVRVRTQG